MKKYIIILIIFLSILIYPILGNSIKWKEILLLIIFFRFCYFIGGFVEKKWNLTDYFLQINKDFFRIYLGMFLTLPILFLSPFISIFTIQVVVVLLTMFFEFKFIEHKSYQYKDLSVFIIIFFYLSTIVTKQYLFDAQSRFPVYISGIDLDNSFFITLVSSFKDGNFYANFENGTIPLYQNFGVLLSSWLAAFSGVPSKVALNGIVSEFNILFFVIISIEILRSITSDKNYIIKWIVFVMSLILLQPIHILKLISFDIGNFVWGGLGYLSQGMNVGFSSGIAIMIFIIYLTINLKKFEKYTSLYIVLAILNAWLVLVKLPLFVLSTAWLGLISLFYLFKIKSNKLLITIIISTILSVFLIFIFYLGKSAAIIQPSTTFFISYTTQLFSLPKENFILLIFTFIVFYFYQLGIKLFIFLPNFKFENNWLETLKWLIIPTFFILFLATILFNGNVYDNNGIFVRSFSSDSLQFLRVISWLISIFTSLSLVNFIERNHLTVKSRIVICSFIVWAIIVAASLIYNFSVSEKITIDYKSKENVWLRSIRNDLTEVNGNNMIISNESNYNLMLTSCDVGNFWVSFGPNAYNNSTKYYPNRRKIVDEFLFGNVLEKQNAYLLLKKNHIDYCVATPLDIDKFLAIKKMGLIEQYKTGSYLFKLQ